MTALYLILSGMVMGLVAAVPIGPVNLICIRRSFAFGPVNGFASGLGAALGDGLFAAIMGFGLTWIAQMIEGYTQIIELIGGALMVWMGYKTFVSPTFPRNVDDKADKEGFFSGLGTGISEYLSDPRLLASGVAAQAQDDGPDHDVVIEIDEQSVTYNGAAVAGLLALEEELVEDVEADPQLTVKVLAHDTVPMVHVTQIVDAVRRYEIECEVEIVSSAFEQDDNL